MLPNLEQILVQESKPFIKPKWHNSICQNHHDNHLRLEFKSMKRSGYYDSLYWKSSWNLTCTDITGSNKVKVPVVLLSVWSKVGFYDVLWKTLFWV